MPPNDRTGPVGVGPAPENTLAVGASGVAFILEPSSETAANVRSFRPLPDEIARGSAGDCCILCGLVGINLSLDHGCRPNIDVEAYQAQRKRAAEIRDRRWTS
jgi:hypothetical protein